MNLWSIILNVVFIIDQLNVLLSYYEQTRTFEIIGIMLKALIRTNNSV